MSSDYNVRNTLLMTSMEGSTSHGLGKDTGGLGDVIIAEMIALVGIMHSGPGRTNRPPGIGGGLGGVNTSSLRRTNPSGLGGGLGGVNTSGLGGSSSSTSTKPKEEPKAPESGGQPPKERYQIFLSFRGKDTRRNFTRYLYDALKRDGFKVFMDNKGMRKGDSLSKAIPNAIENSKLSIIIFSENFGDSTWCLDEVVMINKCRENDGQLVWPIFHKVEPYVVRRQKNKYEEAMNKHEARLGSKKVEDWKLALNQICDIHAFEYTENRVDEADFLQEIVQEANKIRDILQAWI